MIKSFNKNNKFQFGYTLIEIIVVISIIGFILTVALYAFNYSRALARDTKRVADLSQIKKSIEMFRNEKGHYPDTTDFGDNSGECIGDQDSGGNNRAGITGCSSAHANPYFFEVIIKDYMNIIPADPRHDGSNFYYSYDPAHYCPGGAYSDCGTLCFHKSESGKYTCSNNNPICGWGSDMNQDTAVYCIIFDPRQK